MYDKQGAIVVISNSSFLLEEPERRISRAIVGVVGPVVRIYVYIGLGAQSEDIK